MYETNILILQLLFPTSIVSRHFTLFKNLKYVFKKINANILSIVVPFKHNLYNSPLNFKNQGVLHLYHVTIPLHIQTKRHVY